MRIARRLACASALLLAAAAAAEPAPKPCPAPQVRVAAADREDFGDVCAGASDALAFFARVGLRPSAPVLIEVVSTVPAEAGPTAAGCYLERRNRVFMLPYARFRKNGTWFKVPIDRALYRSLAAHEAAHALAACSFGIANPTIQAKEYVAYVAMFSTMSPGLRERALQALTGAGFESAERITPLLYMFDPMRFGAEAYRHYLKPENGAPFLQAVLAGKVLTD